MIERKQELIATIREQERWKRRSATALANIKPKYDEIMNSINTFDSIIEECNKELAEIRAAEKQEKNNEGRKANSSGESNGRTKNVSRSNKPKAEGTNTADGGAGSSDKESEG